MEIIGTFLSRTAARKVIDEMAATGGWKVVDTDEQGAIYAKGQEELLVSHEGDRVYKAVRRSKGEMTTVKVKES